MNKILNLKLRLNPYTISAIVSAILTAMNIKPSTLTSWPLLMDQIEHLVSNPFLFFTTLVTVLGILHDPTTKGFKDCNVVLDNGDANDKDVKQ